MIKAISVLLVILLSALCACSTEATPPTASFQAMDTVMSLSVYGDKAICHDLQDKIELLDSLLDASDENSEISRLNNEKTAVLSEDTAQVLRASLSLCDDLADSFDITVYPAVQAWGFTTGDCRVPDDDELAALASHIAHHAVQQDGDTFTIPEEAMIDLGAVAKGYAADVCTAILSDSSVSGAILNLGGTVCLCGSKPDGSRFHVGVADPDDPAGYFGTLTCGEGVLSTSGGYERYFDLEGKRYIHILDPKTASPVDNDILSVTVYIRSDIGEYPGTRADALSTALFVMGADKAAEYYRQSKDFDCIILTKDGNVYITEGVCDDFALTEGYNFTLHKI